MNFKTRLVRVRTRMKRERCRRVERGTEFSSVLESPEELTSTTTTVGFIVIIYIFQRKWEDWGTFQKGSFQLKLLKFYSIWYSSCLSVISIQYCKYCMYCIVIHIQYIQCVWIVIIPIGVSDSSLLDDDKLI